MTTLVAVQGSRWAVVGWDSRVVDDQRVWVSAWDKVAVNGGYLLGAAGDVRAINLLHHVFVPPKPPKVRGVTLERFITARFIPALRECFDDHGYTPPRRTEAEQHGSQVLVVVNATVFVVDSDWSWVKAVDGLYSIGSGSAFAFGVLSQRSVRTQATAQEAVREALVVAGRFDNGTGEPYRVTTQTYTNGG